MRKYWLLAPAALLALGIVVIFLRPASKPGDDAPPLTGSVGAFQKTGKPVAEISFKTGEGKTVALADMRGKVVLLNLWATWCGPCVREMPTLDRLQAELGGPAFEVVALSSDHGGAKAVEPFLRDNKLNNLGVYLDPTSQATRALEPRGLPTTLLIDKDGREVGRLEGAAEWDSAEAKALIRHYRDRPG